MAGPIVGRPLHLTDDEKKLANDFVKKKYEIGPIIVPLFMFSIGRILELSILLKVYENVGKIIEPSVYQTYLFKYVIASYCVALILFNLKDRYFTGSIMSEWDLRLAWRFSNLLFAPIVLLEYLVISVIKCFFEAFLGILHFLVGENSA
jgi:hypothetical protein